MLPPGHIAAGYLVAEALIRVSGVAFTDVQVRTLLLTGMIFAFAPDLDMFYGFARKHAWTASSTTFNHRKFVSHAPVLWLIAGLSVFAFASDPFVQCIGLLLWLAPWSHFLLDSIRCGVSWLWPFSDTPYALTEAGKPYVNGERRFFRYWTGFVLWYAGTVVFPLELIVIACAIAVSIIRY
jgi:membrane-bound metal-dependent hydrolase YbcI (DUF457 family)